MCLIDFAESKKTRFVGKARGKQNQSGIAPKCPGLGKSDAVFLLVEGGFVRIPFKFHTRSMHEISCGVNIRVEELPQRVLGNLRPFQKDLD